MASYIPLKRKFDANQFLNKHLKLRTNKTEGMTSYHDTSLKKKIDYNKFLAKDFG